MVGRSGPLPVASPTMLARARVGTSTAKSPGGGTVLIIPGRTREGLDLAAAKGSPVLPAQIFSSGCPTGSPDRPDRADKPSGRSATSADHVRHREEASCPHSSDRRCSPISPAARGGRDSTWNVGARVLSDHHFDPCHSFPPGHRAGVWSLLVTIVVGRGCFPFPPFPRDGDRLRLWGEVIP